MAKQAKDGDRYVVLHGAVGGGVTGTAAVRGDVVAAADLVPDQDGHVDQGRLRRLLDLGAIAPEGSDEAQAAQPEGEAPAADAPTLREAWAAQFPGQPYPGEQAIDTSGAANPPTPESQQQG